MNPPKPETQLIREAFGDTIHAWREGRGWTRTELAARLGMTRQNLLHIETGRNDPTYATLMRLARGLGTTAWNLGRCIELRLTNQLPGDGSRGLSGEAPHVPGLGAPRREPSSSQESRICP